MNMTVLDLIKPEGHVEPFDDISLTDLLWLHTVIDDGVEHLRTHITGNGARVIVFSADADAENSRRSAEALCRRAISAAPQLRGWRLG